MVFCHHLCTQCLLLFVRCLSARRLHLIPGVHPVLASTRQRLNRCIPVRNSEGERPEAGGHATPCLALAPYPFQEEAIECLLSTEHRGLLLADEMGLGKTVSVISAMNRQPDIKRALIVAPKSVLFVWHFEFSKWLTRPLSVGMATAAKGMPEEQKDILLINYEIVEKYRTELDQLSPWDVMVCDEAHYLKNPDTIRTKAILGNTKLKATRNAYSPFGGLAAKRIWFLTGSPILNNPLELFPMLRSLDPQGASVPATRDYDEFAGRYCRKLNRRFGARRLGIRYAGAKNTKELRRLLRGDMKPPLMIRRTKKQVLSQLPAKRHSLVPVVDEAVACKERTILLEEQGRLLEEKRHASPKTRSLLEEPSAMPPVPKYEDLNNALAAWASAPANQFEFADDEVTMGMMAKARHQTALEKVPLAIELIETAIASNKVVVFAHHRDVQERLWEHFKDRSVMIHGDTKQEERAEAVQRFQEDDAVLVFIGSIRAAGVGITLTAASHVLFVEFDWSPMIMQQAEDRCHRIGQLDSVLVQYLYFEGTVDELLAKSLATKLVGISAALDGHAEDPASAYLFDFGKHKGKTILDVAASDPFYLNWLVEREAYKSRPALRAALRAIGKLSEGESSRVEGSPSAIDVLDVNPGDPSVAYTFGSGKHKGKTILDVAAGDSLYLNRLVEQEAYKSRPALRAALRAIGKLPEEKSSTTGVLDVSPKEVASYSMVKKVHDLAALDKVLDTWNLAKSEEATVKKKIEDCKKQVKDFFVTRGTDAFTTDRYEVSKRMQSVELVSKKDCPADIWSQHAKTITYPVISVKAKDKGKAKAKGKATKK